MFYCWVERSLTWGDRKKFLLLGATRVFDIRCQKCLNVGCQKSVFSSGAKRVFYCWVPKECLKVGCQKSVSIVGCQKSVLLLGAKRVS